MMLQYDDDTHHFQVASLSLFDQQFGAEEFNKMVIKLKKDVNSFIQVLTEWLL